jgi:hypothetical protein
MWASITFSSTFQISETSPRQEAMAVCKQGNVVFPGVVKGSPLTSPLGSGTC